MVDELFIGNLTVDEEMLTSEYLESQIIRDTAELGILVECISESMFIDTLLLVRESEGENNENDKDDEYSDVLTERERTLIKNVTEKVVKFIMAAVAKITEWTAKIGSWWRMRVYKPLKEELDKFTKIDKSKLSNVKMKVYKCEPSHHELLNLGTILIIKEGEAKTTESELHELSQQVARKKVTAEMANQWEKRNGYESELEKLNLLIPKGVKKMTKDDLPKLKKYLSENMLNNGEKIEKSGEELYSIVSNFKDNWRDDELKNRLDKGKAGIKEIQKVVKEFKVGMENLDLSPLGAEHTLYSRYMDAVMRVYSDRVKTYNYIYTGGMWLCTTISQEITKVCKLLNKVGGGK